MAYSLYDAAVTPCAQQLGALTSIIDKAAAHCVANKIEIGSAAGPVVSRHVLPRPPDPSVSGFRHEHRRPPSWRYSPRRAGCGRHQLRRRQKPRRNRPRVREVLTPRTGRRRGGQGYRLDRRRQRPENEGQRLSATVRPAEFLLLCNDGVQHPASPRRPLGKRDFLGPVNWLSGASKSCAARVPAPAVAAIAVRPEPSPPLMIRRDEFSNAKASCSHHGRSAAAIRSLIDSEHGRRWATSRSSTIGER